MRNILVAFMLTFFCTNIISQSEYPKSIINLGVGFGSNYGFLGIKSIIGYKNSGLVIGAGTAFGMIEFAIGGQISSKWWYLNIGYGPYGIIYDDSIDQKDVLRGLHVISGAMINLNKSKRLFIEIGLGFAWGASPTKFLGNKVETNLITGELGIGYRLGGI
ncbi:MAG: hypothetical protein WAS55_13980 [Saprospiraceae bacterium]